MLTSRIVVSQSEMAISKGFYSPKKRTILDVLDIDFHPWLLFEFTTAIVSFIKGKKKTGSIPIRERLPVIAHWARQ